MLNLYKFTRLAKRILLPLVLLIYLSLVLFNLHTRNAINNHINQTKGYEGGLIDDIKIIRCSRLLYGNCNQIIEKNNQNQEIIWHKIDKFLDKNQKPTTSSSSWQWYNDYLYIHLYDPGNEKFNYPGKVISDIAIGDANSQDPPYHVVQDSQSLIGKAKSRLDAEYNYHNWDLKPNGIWVKYEKADNPQVITDLTYYFGQDIIEPRDDWNLASGRIMNSNLVISMYQSSKSQKKLDLKELKINGPELKILQLSDLHFNSNFGKCKDQYQKNPQVQCNADSKTLNFIHTILDLESPNLVVITGDLIDGFNTVDYQTAILKAVSPFISRKIPYAIALGFHDINKYVPREEIVKYLSSLPYSILNQDTNYILKIFDSSSNLQTLIYILDVFKESPNQLEILESQLENLENQPKFSLIFQHAPIADYRPKDSFAIVGQYHEKSKLPSRLSSHASRRFIDEHNIHAISVGYEHTNECCIFNEDKGLKPLWMCYSGGAGEAGYAREDQDRRVRFFRIDSLNNEITSWKRKQSNPNQVFDYQYIYNAKQS
ncbi:hypothetical protein WICMUC_002598 [Wickerhamomyces mucosus]|uniref:Calcineurin-like phosphoesterase domain-containing protein n=1 Tax=Wickerhamomyces mucosus TaxID=1378264 RepID=A0A9P8TE96_9ASCO|nr:hypothetical protein WICMUC_002598 [Wickerhamomyces mucosus]